MDRTQLEGSGRALFYMLWGAGVQFYTFPVPFNSIKISPHSWVYAPKSISLEAVDITEQGPPVCACQQAFSTNLTSSQQCHML